MVVKRSSYRLNCIVHWCRPTAVHVKVEMGRLKKMGDSLFQSTSVISTGFPGFLFCSSPFTFAVVRIWQGFVRTEPICTAIQIDRSYIRNIETCTIYKKVQTYVTEKREVGRERNVIENSSADTYGHVLI